MSTDQDYNQHQAQENLWVDQPGHNYHMSDDSTAEEPFPLFDYLQLLWFRRRLIIVVSLFIAIVGFIYVNQLKPVYTATSTMMIGSSETQVVDIEQVLSGELYENEAVEVLRSRNLVEKVINNLSLMSYEEFNPALRVSEDSFFDSLLQNLNPRTWIPDGWETAVTEAISGEVQSIAPSEEEIAHRQLVKATDIFLSKLSVESVSRSSVLKVHFKSLSPVLAARIANELPEVYMLDGLQAKFDATEKATAWLTEQLADLKVQVSESERAVEIYREDHDLSKSTTSNIQSDQLSEFNSQLIVARADRAEIEARLAQLMRLQRTEGQGIEMAGDVLASKSIQLLRSQEGQAMRRVAELAVEYGAKHPLMRQAKAEIEDIKQRVAGEMNKIKLALENELELVRTREQSLRNSLRESEQQSSAQNKGAVQLRALEREAAANRVMYETFLGRFKETSSTQGMQTSDARVISVAEVPRGPSYPNKKRKLILITVLGFAAGCGLVLGLYFMNPGMHSPEQVEKELGVRAIGLVPKVPGGVAPHQYLLEKPQSGFMEAINSLKVSLRLADPDGQHKVIQVTSSVPEEGKSSLVLSLAVAIAKEGKKVLVIDADLRRSTVQKTLGVEGKGLGLTDFVLASTEVPDEFISTHENTGIDFMRTGTARYANATDIFTSQRMQSILNVLKQRYDYVLLDTPPVMAVADARVIGQIADKTIFVVRWDKTPRKVARASIGLLRKGHTDIAGIVLQQVDLKRYGKLGYGDSGYYYHYGRYNKYYQS